MPAKPKSIQNWVESSLTKDPPRSKSLIVTVFGDSLLPYVSGVWMSELIALLEPFRINSQLTRTSAFRLASENWLQSHREGRRSLYALTEPGRQRVEHAYHRIYEPPPRDWDGNWTVVILSKVKVPLAVRTEVRHELEWEGYGLASSGVFLHPRASRANLDDILRRFRLVDTVVVMQARDLDGVVTKPGARLAGECWDLKRVADHYRGFLVRFQPLERLVHEKLNPRDAFLVQTLLIHSFRRVVLHDPQLPAVLLPDDWPGHAAYDLCRAIYRKTFAQTRAHLSAHLESARTSPLRPPPDFHTRLGGLFEPNFEPQTRRL